jgi:hypothetical protein
LLTDPESSGNFGSQGLHSVAFGRVVTGGDVMNPHFTRQVEGWFGNFAADKRIDALPGGGLDKTLRGPGAPGQPGDLVVAGADRQRPGIEPGLDGLGQFLQPASP